MKILTIDFETFYSQEYSLTKMTTEEYVRGGEFEVIGVSVQVDDGEPQWFSGTMSDTEEWLKQFDFEGNYALAHNAAFDGAILSWVFGRKPKHWMDTLSMGRALHGTEVGGSLAVLAEHYGLGVKGTEVVNAKGLRRLDFPPDQLARYAEYCKNDVALTCKLFHAMMQSGFPLSELKLIDLTIKMYSDPVLRLDSNVLNEHLLDVQHRKEELISSVTMVDKEQLMSNYKFAATLKLFGVEPPMKKSPTTGAETYAFAKTDEGFKALLEHEDPRIQALAAARLGVKSTLEETRTQRFIDMAGRNPLMPVPLRYYAAHTGRWGGDDKLNLQNLPRKSRLKYSIVAPKEYVIIDADSSQIEARTLVWLAEQEDMIEVFNRNNEEIAAGIDKKDFKYDPYKLMASRIYGTPTQLISDSQRFMGKTALLGCGYGLGPARFKVQLKASNVDITEEDAGHIVSTYREANPKVVQLWKDAHNILNAILSDNYAEFGRGGILKVEGKRGIRLPNELYLKYPNLRKVQNDEGKVEFMYDTKRGKQSVPTRVYGGKIVENVCQALARIAIGEQMLLIAKKYRVVLTVHDAIAIIAPEEERQRAVEFVELCMRIRPKWAPDLPLNCESGYGASYGDC
jgi:DNA polymerase I-like protein with 3'-5' exonuclease and polymerase domains